MITQLNMETGMIVTILLAAAGWVWGVCQFIAKRRWQKKDRILEWRYEAYNKFMNKLDELNEPIRSNPNLIFGDTEKLLQIVQGGSFENLSEALMQYNQSLIDMVKESTKPLLMINQEVNALTLIASEELREKLKCLKELVTDLNNEMQNCLSVVSAKDSNSFKYFETIGHNKRWVEYQKLYDEIVKLMRKEINVK